MPNQITQVDAQQVFDAGWDEHAYFDSVCSCAIMNCMNRFVTALSIDVDLPGINYSDKMLFTLGYLGLMNEDGLIILPLDEENRHNKIQKRF